jgi:hypothetical protein
VSPKDVKRDFIADAEDHITELAWNARIHIHAGDCTKEHGSPTPAQRLNIRGASAR